MSTDKTIELVKRQNARPRSVGSVGEKREDRGNQQIQLRKLRIMRQKRIRNKWNTLYSD
jgi:hypothetical protein